jgi:hypothetical protein
VLLSKAVNKNQKQNPSKRESIGESIKSKAINLSKRQSKDHQLSKRQSKDHQIM